MEGTDSQRAAPRYDAVAQRAVITPFPPPSHHSHEGGSSPRTTRVHRDALNMQQEAKRACRRS